MPEISRFLGIVIKMYHDDHEPPHFHAWYSGEKAQIEIETLALLKGQLPPRVLRLVVEWAWMHRQELVENWNLARHRLPLRRVAPLE